MAGGDSEEWYIEIPADTTEYKDAATQVVVVGSGMAGLSAAVEAVGNGLDVILVEQLGIMGGSSIRAGLLVGGDTNLQAAQGIAISSEEVTEKYIKQNDYLDEDLFDYGLYACGEVTGGVHGDNRVGGNAILDCLVYGYTAGTGAGEYVK